jgi:hypothetical protein
MVQISMVLALILAAFVFSACISVVLTVLTVAARRALSKKYEQERQRLADDLAESLRTFITAADATTPSPLAVLVDQFAILLAARLVQSVKGMIAGTESGVAKGEQLALLEDVTKDSPLLTLLSGLVPRSLRTKLLKNPQMVGALSKLGSLGSNHGADTASAPRRHRE